MSVFPVILSSPSGGGKTTIARELMALRDDAGYSVSCTTRAPRDGERDGVDYHFLSREKFAAARDRGDFAEHAEVHGELYGTLRREVDAVLRSGRHVLMVIDVQGAIQFARVFPDSVLIFVMPPTAEVLLERLRARRTESADDLARRLETAAKELRAASRYHYVVVNDDLPSAVARVSAIIDAESSRTARMADLDGIVSRMAGELGKH